MAKESIISMEVLIAFIPIISLKNVPSTDGKEAENILNTIWEKGTPITFQSMPLLT